LLLMTTNVTNSKLLHRFWNPIITRVEIITLDILNYFL
jgi:hypothetical protein